MKSLLPVLLALLASCAMPAAYRSGDAPPSSDDAGGFTSAAPATEVAAISASLEAPPLDVAQEPDAPESQRQVIYSAALRLVVVSAREARLSIVTIAKEAGGHMQESDARSVTVRVPAARFEPVLERLERLGEVADSSVRASDVTEEMLDLGIRLENARRARDRLLEHLAKSQAVEDTLKIEAELTRVTEELERIEGRLRYLGSQVAMSTIRVELNTNQPQRAGDEVDLPFQWVARLGDGLVAGTVQAKPREPAWFSRGPSFEPPAGFVRYYRSSELVEAMDAEGVRLKVQLHDNFDSGALSFWSRLARNSLVQRRSLAVSEERALDGDRAWITGTREIGRETLGYLLVLVRTDDEVCTYEAWGPREVFERRKAELIRSAATLSP